MAYKLIFSVFFLGYVCFVFSAQWHTKPYQHPSYPGQCYDTEANEAYLVGESNSNSKGCKWQKCEPDFSFAVTSCAPLNVPEGCIASEPDLSQPYPDCCSQPIC